MVNGDKKLQGRWQFSLRAVLAVVTGVAVVLAVAARWPRPVAFAAFMTSLVIAPLLIAATLRLVVGRISKAESGKRKAEGGGLWALRVSRKMLRDLGLVHGEEELSVARGVVVAASSMLVLIGLWPVLREVGLQLAVATSGVEWFTLETAIDSLYDTLRSSRYWLRLWQWEAWSVGRWWMLFGAMATVWLVAQRIADWPSRAKAESGKPKADGDEAKAESGKPKAEGTATVFARLLAFAPWIMVLEILFLIGVWVSSPQTVPEPSTGFVVGIFTWDLWHWDCWKDREWLIRGAAPTFVVGAVFFRQVLRWPWIVAAIAAVGLIPVALMWSIACTVAWQNGFPWLFKW